MAVSSSEFPADNFESLAGVLYEIEPDNYAQLYNLV